MFIFGVAGGVLPGDGVGDLVVEVIVIEGVLLGVVPHEGSIIGGAEVLPVDVCPWISGLDSPIHMGTRK